VVNSSISLLVPKEKIAENGEYNLTGERYRVVERRGKQKWPMVRLGDVCEINPESAEPKILFGKTDFTYIDISSVENGTGNVSFSNRLSTEDAPSRARRIVRNDDLLVSTVRPNLKAFTILKNIPEKCIASTGFAILRGNDIVLPVYLYNMILSNSVVSQMTSRMGKGAYPSINTSDLEEITIPLPPIEVQGEIVAEIEGYQKVIDGARQVVDNWKPQIEVDPEWPTVSFDSLVSITTGKLDANAAKDDGKYPFFTCSKIIYKIDTYDFDCEALLLAGNNATANYDIKYYKGKFNAYQRTYVITVEDTDKILYPYLQIILEQKLPELKSKSTGNLTKYLTLTVINQLVIPLPPLEIQQELVAKIGNERKLVDGCRELVTRYEERIKKVVNEAWGE
jgi:restriction endonuclease S subunit